MERAERDLIKRCLAGDQAACAELVQAYSRLVGTVIWRATGNRDAVEDLAQETFMRVFRALVYFDARASLSTWIYTIAHRVAVDHLRKTGRWREDPLPETDNPTPALDPEASLARVESQTVVRQALEKLPDKFRLPLLYAAIEELDYSTIAAMLGVPIGTVKTLVFRGKRMLKNEMTAMLARDRN